MNYNNEPNIFKRGTLLVRKMFVTENLKKTIIVDVHDDLLKKSYWKESSEILGSKVNSTYEGPTTHIVSEQINKKNSSCQIQDISGLSK